MMKDLLISLLQTIIAKLKDKDCVISDDVALDLIALGEKLVEDNNPISKTEAFDLLHCSTKTVERIVAEGILHKGRKRPCALYTLLEACRHSGVQTRFKEARA